MRLVIQFPHSTDHRPPPGKMLWPSPLALIILGALGGLVLADGEKPCVVHDGRKYYDLNPLKSRYSHFTFNALALRSNQSHAMVDSIYQQRL